MQEINRDKLVRELRGNCMCLQYTDDCSKCAEKYPKLCRQERELFKAAADMLEADGRKNIETNIYDQEEIHHNCTVQILHNSFTGEQSVGWWKEDEPPVEV